MLNKIRFSYRVADKQEGLFTPCHTLFKCKIKIDGLQYTFNYQCNTSHKEPNLKNCLDCLLLDASCYEQTRDEFDFCSEMGYDDLYAGVKAYKACKKTYKALHRLFTDEELNTLYEEVSDC